MSDASNHNPEGGTHSGGGDHYSSPVPLDELRPAGTGEPPQPDLLLRILEQPAVKIRAVPLLDLLRPAYRRLSER